MKLVTFGIDQKRNLIIQFPIFGTALYLATTNVISVRDGPSPYSRSNHQSTILHRTQNKEAIHSTKLGNIYKHLTARTSYLQEIRI